MMNKILDRIEGINFHKFQKQQINIYEQGNKLDRKTNNDDNRYVSVPKIMNLHVKKNNEMKTVFEKIVYIYENGEQADVKYKEKFYRSLSDEVYKSVSKRYNILKKNMMEFIYETEYALPIQKEIVVLLCNILKSNIVITLGNEYYKYVEGFEKTILIDERKSCVYDTQDLCEMDLASKGYYENVDLSKMKLFDIKRYIEKYKMVMPDNIKKKEDLIVKIKEIRGHK